MAKTTPPPKASSKVKAHILQQDDSRLTRLPAELRNRIYELALPDTIIIPRRRPKMGIPCNKVCAPGLLLTCKQIYQEAIGLYYSSTSFWFKIPDDFARWARIIGIKKLKVIRKIVLMVPYSYDQHYSFKSVYTGNGETVRSEGIRDPAAALRATANKAQGVLDEAVAKTGVSAKVVNVALQVSASRQKKWWTTEPIKFVEEVIAEADKKYALCTGLSRMILTILTGP